MKTVQRWEGGEGDVSRTKLEKCVTGDVEHREDESLGG